MTLGMQVGLGPGHIVLDGDPAPSQIFGPFLLWPKGWMHQDATRYGGRPQPRGLCVRRGHSPPSQKGAESPQIFDPCLLWPNGWIDQDNTWHGGRPQPRRPCGVRWGPSPLPKKAAEHPPKFLARFCCGQTAGCTKMPLGTELGLSPGDFVLDGDPAPPQKGGGAPTTKFSAHVCCGQTAG